MPQLTAIDFTVLDWIRDNLSCPFMDQAMKFFTMLGNNGGIWIVLAACFLITKNNKRSGIAMICALTAGLLVGNLCLKTLVARLRPFQQSTDVIKLLIAPPDGFSFPSGHSLSSFAAATVIALQKKNLAIIVYPIAALIAFSRLYLYVHFPSDVLAGAVIGTALGCLFVYIVNKVSKRYQDKQAKEIASV